MPTVCLRYRQVGFQRKSQFPFGSLMGWLEKINFPHFLGVLFLLTWQIFLTSSKSVEKQTTFWSGRIAHFMQLGIRDIFRFISFMTWNLAFLVVTKIRTREWQWNRYSFRVPVYPISILYGDDVCSLTFGIAFVMTSIAPIMVSFNQCSQHMECSVDCYISVVNVQVPVIPVNDVQWYFPWEWNSHG